MDTIRCVFYFMVNATLRLGDIAFRPSIVKRTFLLFMMTVTLAGAIEWENEATFVVVCSSSRIHLEVSFKHAFQGTIYQSRGYFNPRCSYMVPPGINVTEVDLSIPFDVCDVQITEVDNKTIASTEVVIQMHTLLDSIYDKTVNVSCDIENFYLLNKTESDNSFEAQGLENSWIEFKNGFDLFGEVGEPTESTLFMVVNVRDGGLNQDMIVRSCFAHTDKNITNATTLHELSNFYGCPDPSAVLTNFTVIHPEYDQSSMFAYAAMKNFSLIAFGGRMSVSCGITICENACPAHCNDTESPIQLPLSDYATKEIVTRSDGAVLPDSLRDLNRHNDRSRRTPRSILSFFRSFFQWESQIMTGSVSEGNVTNTTTISNVTREISGLVVKHDIIAKDFLASSKKPVHVNQKNSTSNLIEEFHMDWVTFRFIALMTVCMFVTVVACYCCYADDIKKSQRSLHEI